jgi:hypothetical protein
MEQSTTVSNWTADHCLRMVTYFYFGELEEEPLKNCINKAYGDLKRTLRGIATSRNRQATRDAANSLILSALHEVCRFSANIDQSTFDDWHRRTCTGLCTNYHANGYKDFRIGHAQKWLNMSLKYAFVLAPVIATEHSRNFEHLYSFCHVPFDSIVIERLELEGFKYFPWSKLEKYEEYLSYQNWIRERFHIAPLELECHLWMDRNFDLAPYRKDSANWSK